MTRGQINIIDFLHKIQTLKAEWQDSADDFLAFMAAVQQWEECHVNVRDEFDGALEVGDIVFYEKIQSLKDGFQSLYEELKEVRDSWYSHRKGKQIDFLLDGWLYLFAEKLEKLSYFSNELKQYFDRYSLVYGKPQQEQAHPEPQQEKPKPQRGRGRAKEPFSSCMRDDPNGEKLQKLHQLMTNKKGKGAALVILAAMKKGWIDKPTFSQVTDEFGDIGAQQGFTGYLNTLSRYTEEEIEGAINSLG